MVECKLWFNDDRKHKTSKDDKENRLLKVDSMAVTKERNGFEWLG